MPNIRQKEVATEIAELLRLFLNKAWNEANINKVSPYDVELNVNAILTEHRTNRCIVTETCSLRHYENLENRGLFIHCGKDTVKLNRLGAEKNITILNNVVPMPEDKIPNSS